MKKPSWKYALKISTAKDHPKKHYRPKYLVETKF